MAKQNLMIGDCMDLMRSKPDKFYDLAIVDPPYNGSDAIDLKDNKDKSKQATKRTEYKYFENIMPTPEYFKELDRICKRWIVWGGNYFGLSGGVIVWNKHGTAFGEGEVAICNTHQSVRIFDYTWNGMIQENMKSKEIRIHSCQKPVALYKYILNKYATKGDKILDTHGGSFSHAIAAYDLGFDLDIIELDPDYCREGKARFDNHVLKCEEIKQLGYAKSEISKINPILF